MRSRDIVLKLHEKVNEDAWADTLGNDQNASGDGKYLLKVLSVFILTMQERLKSTNLSANNNECVDEKNDNMKAHGSRVQLYNLVLT